MYIYIYTHTKVYIYIIYVVSVSSYMYIYIDYLVIRVLKASHHNTANASMNRSSHVVGLGAGQHDEENLQFCFVEKICMYYIVILYNINVNNITIRLPFNRM